MPTGKLRARLTGGDKPLLLVFARPEYKDGNLKIDTAAKAVFACKWEYQNTNLMDPNCEWSFDVSLLGFDALIDVNSGPSGWTYCIGVKNNKLIIKDCNMLYKDTNITSAYSADLGPSSKIALVSQSHILTTFDLQTSKLIFEGLSTDSSLKILNNLGTVDIPNGQSCVLRSASYQNGIAYISFENCPSIASRLNSTWKSVYAQGTAAMIEDELYSRDPTNPGAFRVARLTKESFWIGENACGDQQKSCLLNMCSDQQVCGKLEINSVQNYSSAPTLPKLKEIRGFFGSKISIPWTLPEEMNGMRLEKLSLSDEFKDFQVTLSSQDPVWNINVLVDGKKLQELNLLDVSLGDDHMFGLTKTNMLVFASCTNLKTSQDTIECTMSPNRVQVPKSLRFLYWKSKLVPRNGVYVTVLTSSEEYRPVTVKLVGFATVSEGVKYCTDPKWLATDIEVFFGADFPSSGALVPDSADQLFVVLVNTADSVIGVVSEITIKQISLKDFTNKTAVTFDSRLVSTEFFCPRSVSRSTEIQGTSNLRVVSYCAQGVMPEDYRVIEFDPFQPTPASGSSMMRHSVKEYKIPFNNSVSHICLLRDKIVYSSNYSQDFMASNIDFASKQARVYLGLSKFGLYDTSGGDANSMAYCLPEYGMALLGHHGLSRDKRWTVASKVTGIAPGLFSNAGYRISAHELQPKEVGSYKGSHILRSGKSPVVVHVYEDRAQNGNFFFRTQYLFARPVSSIEVSQQTAENAPKDVNGFVSAVFSDVSGNRYEWFQDLYLSQSDDGLIVGTAPVRADEATIDIEKAITTKGHVAGFALVATGANRTVPAGVRLENRAELGIAATWEGFENYQVISIWVSSDGQSKALLMYSPDGSSIELFHSGWESMKSVPLPFSYCKVDVASLTEVQTGRIALTLIVSKPATETGTFYFEVQEGKIVHQTDVQIPDAQEVQLQVCGNRIIVAWTSAGSLTHLMSKEASQVDSNLDRMPKLKGLTSISIVSSSDCKSVYITGLESNRSSILITKVRQQGADKVDGNGFFNARPLAEYRAALTSRYQFHSSMCSLNSDKILCVSDTFGSTLLETYVSLDLGKEEQLIRHKLGSSLPRVFAVSHPYLLSVCPDMNSWEVYSLGSSSPYTIAAGDSFTSQKGGQIRLFGVSQSSANSPSAVFYSTNREKRSTQLITVNVRQARIVYQEMSELEGIGVTVRGGIKQTSNAILLKDLVASRNDPRKEAESSKMWLWIGGAGISILALAAITFLTVRYCKQTSSEGADDYSKVSLGGNGQPETNKSSMIGNPKASIIDKSSDFSKTYGDNEL